MCSSDLNEKFIFYQIDNITNKLPSLVDKKFTKHIKNLLFQKTKIEYIKNIRDQLDKKEFNEASFNELASGEIAKTQIKSVKDISKFEANSIEVLYSLSINEFTLIADKENNIFIAKIISYEDPKILQDSNKLKAISNEASAENRNGILNSYNYLINNKYKLIVYDTTLDRVKDYFR